MSRQRKKHQALVYQRKIYNEFVRGAKCDGCMSKMPARNRRKLKLQMAETLHDFEKEEEEIRQEQYQEKVHEYSN